MEETGITWTRSTFNGWVGCQKAGPGCDNCYAEAQNIRWGKSNWGPGAERVRTSRSYWRNPIGWNRQAIERREFWPVFTSSMADVFDNAVPQSWRDDLFALMKATPALTWQVVTKRIGNASKMLPADWGDGYPNVWLLSTVVTQIEALRDIPKLVSIPAVVHGLSVEPQIERVSLRHVPGFDDIEWVIVGGESRQFGACRPFDVQWARDLRDECAEHGSAFFLKQMGHNVVDNGKPAKYPGKGGDPLAWEPDLRVQQFPNGLDRAWQKTFALAQAPSQASLGL